MEDFISDAQDKTRNARTKSELAGFNVWKEQLNADQCQFEAQKIMWLGIASLVLIGTFRGSAKRG